MNILDYLFADTLTTEAGTPTDINKDFILDETISQKSSQMMKSDEMAQLSASTNSVFRTVDTTDAIVFSGQSHFTDADFGLPAQTMH
jgi:hypothetical protein